MAKKKVMLVFGTRPEAIKMCPLVKEFQKNPEEFETIVCVTGQHREMLDQVLTIFDVKPDYDLNIMKQGQDLYDVTARVLTGMRDVFAQCKPDVVLVHGDTTTSTAAALAAFYQQIPVGHVEAGLRTHNIYSPWPEEMNRQITGRIATYDFAPTPLSEKNLQEEKAHGQIFVTGNTVIDALHMVVDKLKSDKALADEQINVLKNAGYDVTRLNGDGLPVPLINIQRMEVIEFLVGTDGIHIGIDTIARLYLVLCQRETLPFSQRVHHLGLGVAQILDGETHRSLHTIQVVINAQSLQHEERCRHAAQPQLRRKVLLKEILDQFDTLLRLFCVEQRLVHHGLNDLSHISVYAQLTLQLYLLRCKGTHKISICKQKRK